MLQTQLPPGELIGPRDGKVHWFEPVIDARDTTEQSVVTDADSVALTWRLSLRRPALPRHEICVVGFAGDTDAPGRTDAGAPRPAMASGRVATADAPLVAIEASDAVAGRGGTRPEPADAEAGARGSQAAAAPPAGAPEAAALRLDAAMAILAVDSQPTGLSRGAAAGLQRLLSSSIRRLLRLGATAAAVGAVAVFAYQGGEHLAGLAGATTPPAAAPDHPAAPLLAPDGDRASNLPSSGQPSDPPGAADYLDRARAGDPVAQYNIAVLYARGDGLVQDFSSAALWFRKAAVSGNVAAEFDLAVSYERGLGVPRNMGEAIQWYRRAAEHNYAAAQYNLAIAYAEGRGVPQDAVAAAHWYRQAAAQGLVPAIVNLAILYEKGEGVDRSFPDAYAWYRAAARRGDGAAEQRARDLFQQFTGAQKGQAVIVADAVAGTIRQPSAEPQPGPLQPPG